MQCNDSFLKGFWPCHFSIFWLVVVSFACSQVYSIQQSCYNAQETQLNTLIQNHINAQAQYFHNYGFNTPIETSFARMVVLSLSLDRIRKYTSFKLIILKHIILEKMYWSQKRATPTFLTKHQPLTIAEQNNAPINNICMNVSAVYQIVGQSIANWIYNT